MSTRMVARRGNPAGSVGAFPMLALVFWCVVVLWAFTRSPLVALLLACGAIGIVIAYWFPWLFMMAAFAAMPFQQSLAGPLSKVNVSATDCIAGFFALALPGIFMRRRQAAIGPAGVPLAFFFLVCTVSSMLTWEGLGTGVSLARMFVQTVVAVWIYANADPRLPTARNCFTAYLLAINVLAVFSLMAFARGGIQASMYTLGIHKNALGPTYGCGIVIALAALLTERPSGGRRTWLLVSLGMATVGIVLTLSRGGWLATGAGCLLLLVLTRNIRAFAISLLVFVPAIVVVWIALPKDSREYASDVSSKAHTIQTRFESINSVIDAFRTNPLIGVGVGLRKKIEPHNVLILTLGETGLLGLVGFVAMFAAAFATFVSAFRRAAGNTTARQILVAGMCVLMVSFADGMMDVYWRRGVGFLGWACVGMAVNIIVLSRREALGPSDWKGVSTIK